LLPELRKLLDSPNELYREQAVQAIGAIGPDAKEPLPEHTDDGGAVCVRHDWREHEKVIRPDLLQLQARRNGITRVEEQDRPQPHSPQSGDRFDRFWTQGILDVQ